MFIQIMCKSESENVKYLSLEVVFIIVYCAVATSSTWCWSWWEMDRSLSRLKCTLISLIITVEFITTLV